MKRYIFGFLLSMFLIACYADEVNAQRFQLDKLEVFGPASYGYSNQVLYDDKPLTVWLEILRTGQLEVDDTRSYHPILGVIRRKKELPAISAQTVAVMALQEAFLRLYILKENGWMIANESYTLSDGTTVSRELNQFEKGDLYKVVASTISALKTPVANQVVRILDAKDETLRTVGAIALVTVDPSSSGPAVPILIAELKKLNADKVSLCKVIGEIGAPAKDAMPSLLELQTDSDKKVRDAASKALKKIQKALKSK